MIEGRDCFVRRVVEIPLIDDEGAFGWGVWVSHKKENSETYRDNFDSATIGPFFGWLSTEIDYFKEPTLNLKTMAHYRGENKRPRIVLEESNHLLFRHQHEGLLLSDAWMIVHHYQPKP